MKSTWQTWHPALRNLRNPSSYWIRQPIHQPGLLSPYFPTWSASIWGHKNLQAKDDSGMRWHKLRSLEVSLFTGLKAMPSGFLNLTQQLTLGSVIDSYWNSMSRVFSFQPIALCAVDLKSCRFDSAAKIFEGHKEWSKINLNRIQVDWWLFYCIKRGLTLHAVIKVFRIKWLDPDKTVLTSSREWPAVGMEGQGVDGSEVSLDSCKLLLEDHMEESCLELSMPGISCCDRHGLLSSSQNHVFSDRTDGRRIDGSASLVSLQLLERLAINQLLNKYN